MDRIAARAWVGRALFLAWFILLLLPSATVFFMGDADSRLAIAVSAGCFAILWLAAGTRWFFILTYPLAFLSVLIVAADLLRGVDLVELAMLAGQVDAREAHYALSPYFVPIGVAALVLATCAAIGFRVPYAMPRRRARVVALIGLFGAAAVMAIAMPSVMLRAWPLNAVSTQIAMAIGRSDFIAMALPWAPVSPRVSGATWSATRAAGGARRETYVVVVGEAVRADRLAACGGQSFLALHQPVIVYCDVMSGASRTNISVPLLVSRDMPGAPVRVSTDATVLRAFEETGFRTYWISEQDQALAWADADVIRYTRPRSTIRRDLLPLVRSALADAAPKKALVLHTYDAHFPYCERFDPREAPAPVDCGRIGAIPADGRRREWIAAYDDAVAEALAFVDGVIDQLRASGEEAFLVYTPDHAENLLDDPRGLYFHALSMPTRFDTRVPMIFWASESWRRDHPREIQALEAHRNVPAMHADLVPTLLGAADIRYAEPRKDVVDLTRAAPGARTRWVEPRLGVAVDGDRLQ